jgi:hypothetical protein
MKRKRGRLIWRDRFFPYFTLEKGIYFEFAGPSGFNGYHGFEIGSIKMKGTVL